METFLVSIKWCLRLHRKKHALHHTNASVDFDKYETHNISYNNN